MLRTPSLNHGITSVADVGDAFWSNSVLNPPSAATAIEPLVGEAQRYHILGSRDLDDRAERGVAPVPTPGSSSWSRSEAVQKREGMAAATWTASVSKEEETVASVASVARRWSLLMVESGEREHGCFKGSLATVSASSLHVDT
eukprot:2006696-Pleurochrysis_carterae.AAC.3